MAGGEPPIPDGFWAKVRWTLTFATSWMIPLVAIERFADGHYAAGWILTGLFAANLFVVSAWDRLTAFLGRSQVTMFYIGLGLLCALGLGISIGKLITRSQEGFGIGTTQLSGANTGRIVWNFDQIASGQANFLNLIRLNQDEIRVVGVGIHGKNTSTDPVSEFSGYVRSDLTNARLPFFIMADDPANATEPPNPFHPQQIPTRAEETFGIPGVADFDLVTYEQSIIQQGVDGVPVSQFLREFGSFTVVLQYDGITVEHRFLADQVKAAVAKFEKDSKQERTTAPRVTRRPTATPPVQSMLPFGPTEAPKPENGKK
jgi:hypothetical protein